MLFSGCRKSATPAPGHQCSSPSSFLPSLNASFSYFISNLPCLVRSELETFTNDCTMIPSIHHPPNGTRCTNQYWFTPNTCTTCQTLTTSNKGQSDHLSLIISPSSSTHHYNWPEAQVNQLVALGTVHTLCIWFNFLTSQNVVIIYKGYSQEGEGIFFTRLLQQHAGSLTPPKAM